MHVNQNKTKQYHGLLYKLGRLEINLRTHPSGRAAAALRCTISALLTPHTFNSIKPLSSSSSYIHHYPQIPNQWSGLHHWRHGPPNHDRFWGPVGPEVEPPVPGSPGIKRSEQCPVGSGSSLAEIGSLVLSTAHPLSKSKLSHLGYCRWREKGLPIGACQPPDKPARPPLPILEARGLDAGPRLVQKLIGFGDHRTADIVARIAAEEVAHVAVGVYWFSSVCQKMNRPPCLQYF
ncbi:unnamed protein product [Cuscuta campestris]|uniref:DUF455 domain-containing protein n=1 Tax=Cuscuta campestris TaxID=132261 RepID=A0A484M6Y0_9ASTE|nr:unnamed protein product [Cuscuta campestris]